MGLVDRKLATIINELSREYYLRGVDPTSAQILADVEEYLRIHQSGAPETKLRVFGKRQKLPLEELNGFFSETKKDIDLLHADRIDLFLRTMRLLSSGNVRTDALRRQLLGLSDQLSEILLMTDKATGVFFGFFDSFNDLKKVDTTSSIDIDLSSGIVTLPISDALQRVKPDIPKIAPPVINVPPGFVNAGININRFADILDSTTSVWRQGYLSPAEEPLDTSVLFKFVPSKHLIEDNLAARTHGTGEDKAEEVRISKFDIYPISASNFRARVTYSVDGVNFVPFEGYPDHIIMRGSKVSLVFPETVVQWIKFDIIVEDFVLDSSGQNLFEFGFRELALYTAGYASQGTLTTTTLQADADVFQSISKVALYAKERQVNDTNRIDYFVTDASLATPNWLPLRNLGRPTDVASETGVVDFRSTQVSPYHENRVSVSSALTTRETVAGRPFYELVTIPSTFKKGTARLLRGLNCWKAEYKMLPFKERQENKVLAFTTAANVKPLYKQEKEYFKGSEVTVATNIGTLDLTYNLYSDSTINALSDLVIGGDNELSYAQTYPRSKVIKITRKRGSVLTASDALCTIENPGLFSRYKPKDRLVRFTSVTLGEIPQIGEFIRITKSGNTYSVDHKFKIVGRGTNYVQVLDPERKLTIGVNYTFEYDKEDLTSFLDNTNTTGKTVKVQKTAGLVGNNNDQWEIDYWRDLAPDENVSASNMIVTNLGGTVVYQPGIDYLFDPPTKTITAIPGGAIYGDTHVKISYDIETLQEFKQGPTTYSTFFEIDYKKAPTLASLSFVNDFERAYVVFNGKEYPFTDSVELFDDIAKNPKDKWIQVVVVSDPIYDDSDSIDTTSAIYKVINATDQASGLTVFKKGVFFRNHRAFLNPLMEVPYFKLKYDTFPTDRSVFSVDANDVLINWNPVDQQDLLYYTAGGSISTREDFELQYAYTTDSDQVVTSIKLKAEFNRDPSEPVHKTPVLEEYSLRLSY